MPVYEFECKQCHKCIELLTAYDDSPCHCGVPMLRLVPRSVGFKFNKFLATCDNPVAMRYRDRVCNDPKIRDRVNSGELKTVSAAELDDVFDNRENYHRASGSDTNFG